MPWNPNAPDTLGFEWAPTRLDTAVVGSEGAAYAVAFTAEATRTLAPGGLGVGHQVTAAGDWTIELYREADYLAARTDAPTSPTFAPTADRHWSGVWTYPTNLGAGNYWQAIGGAPGSGANANYLVSGGPSMGLSYTFYAARFAGLAIPAGQRLLALRLLNDRDIANVPDPNNVSSSETPFADCADAFLTRNTGEERPAGLNPRQTVTYTFRPRNVLATANHSAALAPWAAPGSGFGWILTSYSGPNLQMDCFHLQLVADHVPERRLAWGTGVRFGSGDASGVAQVAPLGDRWTAWVAPGAAPTITAGQRYVLLLRGPKYADRSPFVGRLPLLTPGPPVSGYSSGRVRVDSNGLPTQAVPTDRVGAPLYTGTPTSGPDYPPTSTPAVDSMPYPRQGVQPVLDLVVRQRIDVPTGGVAISQLVLPVARPDYEPASPLVVRVVDNGGTATGGAFILPTADWDALPGAYVLGGRTIKNVRVNLPHALALAAGTWWVEATTADVHPLTEAVPWGLLYLEAFTVNAPPGPPHSFQPGSPELAPAQGGRQSSIMLVSSPVAPTGFTSVRLPAVLAKATEACAGLWDTAALSWTATTLDPAKFFRYELERLDADTEQWQRIAQIEDPALTSFRDYEGRRGRVVRYRLRVMRDDGGTSDWVEAPSWAPEPYCCGIGLVTNTPTVPSLFFTDVEELRTYTNLDAQWLVLRPTYGADYQQAFRPTEQRGVHFTTQLLVGSGTGTAGLPEFDQLRALARADVPAVAVMTERGDRFYAALAVPELSYRPNRLLQVYYANLDAVEITGQAPIIEYGPPAVLPSTIAGTFHMGPHANDKLDSDFFIGFGR